MSDLVIIADESEAIAESARQKLLELKKEYLIEIGDAIVAVRQPNGTVKLDLLTNPTTTDAATGGMWGALIAGLGVPGLARGGRAVITGQPAGEADQDRRHGRAPCSLRRLPDGRGCGAKRPVQENTAADRKATIITGFGIGPNEANALSPGGPGRSAGTRRRPPRRSPEPHRLIAFPPLQGFIREISNKVSHTLMPLA